MPVSIDRSDAVCVCEPAWHTERTSTPPRITRGKWLQHHCTPQPPTRTLLMHPRSRTRALTLTHRHAQHIETRPLTHYTLARSLSDSISHTQPLATSKSTVRGASQTLVTGSRRMRRPAKRKTGRTHSIEPMRRGEYIGTRVPCLVADRRDVGRKHTCIAGTTSHAC
jgi:hypothetical protein